jgi:type IV secretory pathway VirB4 component
MAPSAQPTQSFVPIKEIRNGIVVLKDGSLRSVVMASSINFALKSQDEQESLIYQFQNFLNSLEFPVQIYVQSKKLDIRPYIAFMEERYAAQTNELMKVQTREYIQFIKTFTEGSDIMSKSFFVVIPYSPAILGSGKKKGMLGGLLPSKKDAVTEVETFDENRTQLEQRASIVEQGLGRCGIRIAPLGTEELVELYYKIFNPGDLEKPIINV